MALAGPRRPATGGRSQGLRLMGLGNGRSYPKNWTWKIAEFRLGLTSANWRILGHWRKKRWPVADGNKSDIS